MKFSKVFVALLVLVLALIPIVTLSKDKAPDVVVLTSKNTIILNEEVTGQSASAVIEKAKELDAALGGPAGVKDLVGNKKPLYLYLNTPGGSIQAGLELIESIKGLGRPVNTITGFAASMGFQIAQNLDERLIIQNGVLMSHRAAGEFPPGSFGGEEPSQMTNRAHLWLQRTRELDEQTVRRTNGKQTLASYQHQYAEEMWLTGSESVAQGYADRVVNVRCDKSLNGVTSHEATYLGFIAITYDLSNCPLNSSPQNVKIKIESNHGPLPDQTFLAQGGEFGATCLQKNDPKKLCALDTSLTLTKINEIKKEFGTNFLNKQKQVVHMYW